MLDHDSILDNNGSSGRGRRWSKCVTKILPEPVVDMRAGSAFPVMSSQGPETTQRWPSQGDDKQSQASRIPHVSVAQLGPLLDFLVRGLWKVLLGEPVCPDCTDLSLLIWVEWLSHWPWLSHSIFSSFLSSERSSHQSCSWGSPGVSTSLACKKTL